MVWLLLKDKITKRRSFLAYEYLRTNKINKRVQDSKIALACAKLSENKTSFPASRGFLRSCEKFLLLDCPTY